MKRKNFEKRKSIRHPTHDYSSPSVYFVTICVDYYLEYFGLIKNNTVDLTIYGSIIQKQWLWLAKQYPYVSLDEYIVMPNHFHGIIIVEQPKNKQCIAPLMEMVGAFKSTSSKLIHRAGLVDFAWQRSFHDRVVRNLVELENIRQYIKNNPAEWSCNPIHLQSESNPHMYS